MKKGLLIIPILLILFGCQKNIMNIKLKGNSVVTVEVGEDFEDSGIVIDDNLDVIKRGNVDTSITGDYTITYQGIDKDGNTSNEITRHVKVVDKTSPELLLEDNTIIIKDSFSDKLIIKKISDNYDEKDDIIIENNFTDVINEDKAGKYTIEFTATDTSGNTTKSSVDINYELSDFYKALEYFKEHGEQKTDDDNKRYYSISVNDNLEKIITYDLYEDGTLRILEIFSGESNKSSIHMKGQFDDYRNLEIIYAQVDNRSFDITDYGYDDDATVTQDLEVIMLFDDYSFSRSYKSFYELIAEGYSTITYLDASTFFENKINVTLE